MRSISDSTNTLDEVSAFILISERLVYRRIRALATELAARGVACDGNPFAEMLSHVGDVVISDRVLRAEIERQRDLWQAMNA